VAISTQQADAVTNAAKQWGVPQTILWGVWGMESDFGQNVATSSAGATGDFQFIPSTAQQYGYPQTNTPSAGQFQQQASSAAQYLASLFKQHGNDWNAALQAYSGGGYGLSQVQSKAAQWTGGGLTPPGGNTINTIANLPSTIYNAGTSVGSAIRDAVNTVTGDAKYAAVFVGVMILAILLIRHGVAGGGGSQTRVVPVPV
jgi:membrane-bound lytic murein transglycosylase B